MTDSFARWIILELNKKEKLKHLPSVDAVVKMLTGMEEAASINSLFLTEGAREAVGYFRELILKGGTDSEEISAAAITHRALSIAGQLNKNSLGKVINATGVIIHTNLGRSLLAPEAIKAVQEAAGNYINLEMDLDTGMRGERYVHVNSLLCQITGAESSLVVNNNAAAVLLILSSLAKGREVVVSRGELVEIGGSFRIPAVLALSGARLVEVGTTNKTGAADYRGAVNEETALLLKVHTSNYRIVGFTAAANTEELVALGKEYGLPVVEDLGSGVLRDLRPYGITDEPAVQKLLQAGVDIICFSGDKLLGGPQAGIIVGKKKYIDLIKKNQLTRTLRIDKLTLAALEATLRLYLDDKWAERIPTLRMLTMPLADIEAKAKKLSRQLEKVIGDRGIVEVREGMSAVGGGALPMAPLPTFLVSLEVRDIARNLLAARLRQGNPPLLLRVKQDRLLLDLRTIQPEEFDIIPELISKAVALG